MQTRGQGSMEYLLLLGGAILVVVIFIMVQGVAGEGKNILEINLGSSVKITDVSSENVFIPLTSITEFTAAGGDGKVALTYSAPGASSFILAVEKGDDTFVKTLVNPDDFDDAFTGGPQKFGLPFFESIAEYGAAENGTTYYFRLLACDDQKQCIVSNVVSAKPSAQSS